MKKLLVCLGFLIFLFSSVFGWDSFLSAAKHYAKKHSDRPAEILKSLGNCELCLGMNREEARIVVQGQSGCGLDEGIQEMDKTITIHLYLNQVATQNYQVFEVAGSRRIIGELKFDAGEKLVSWKTPPPPYDNEYENFAKKKKTKNK